MNITKAERDVLNDLQAAAMRSMRSKPTLRVLSGLADKGLIEFDPFSGTAKLTTEGAGQVET